MFCGGALSEVLERLDCRFWPQLISGNSPRSAHLLSAGRSSHGSVNWYACYKTHLSAECKSVIYCWLSSSTGLSVIGLLLSKLRSHFSCALRLPDLDLTYVSSCFVVRACAALQAI